MAKSPTSYLFNICSNYATFSDEWFPGSSPRNRFGYDMFCVVGGYLTTSAVVHLCKRRRNTPKFVELDNLLSFIQPSNPLATT